MTLFLVETVEHIQDGVSGLFTIRQWFFTNFFAPIRIIHYADRISR